ncbi:MAG: protein adenylyltransferase SelO family protein, partial [Pseudomonadota bacterium]
ETIDYGPCAFMEAYHPDTVYSSIDQTGRYAYRNQPRIAQWNLAQLAQCLLPLIEETPEDAVPAAQAAIDRFPELYQAEWLRAFRAKLGLEAAREEDDALAEDLLSAMADNQADFTASFRALCDLPAEGGPETDEAARGRFVDPTAFDAWAVRWRARLGHEARGEDARRAAMRGVNPVYVPRNHLVEQAIEAAQGEGDLGPFAELVEVLSRPFEDQPGREAYARPARPEEAVTATFCGT